MSRVFLKNGQNIIVTLLLIDKNIILNKNDSNGHLICSSVCKSKFIKKNNSVFFYNKKITARKKIISCMNKTILNEISVKKLTRGQIMNVSCVSKGKKYMGAIKKYNFSGLESTHGVSLKHRSIGSTGQCQDPGKVFKGKKMSGRKKNFKRSLSNIGILDINELLNIVIIKGSIPGNIYSNVQIKLST